MSFQLPTGLLSHEKNKAVIKKIKICIQKMFYLQTLVNGTLRNKIIYYMPDVKKPLRIYKIMIFLIKKLKKNYLKVIIFFSAIIETNDKIICVSDFCRSFPIFYYKDKDLFTASNDARILKKN